MEMLGVQPAGMGDDEWAAMCRMQEEFAQALADADRQFGRAEGGVTMEMRRLDDGSFDVASSDGRRQAFLRERFAAAGDAFTAAGFHQPFRWAWR